MTQTTLFLQQHPLAPHTSWKVGGVADFFYQPRDLAHLSVVLKIWPTNRPLTVFGNATNLLIRDHGVRGLVISLHNSFQQLKEESPGIFTVGASVSLNRLAYCAVQHHWFDAAFMAGIPGTIGGALKMNAGAHQKSIWDHVITVTTINRQGVLTTYQRNAFKPSYRHLDGLNENEWFIAATLQFTQQNETAPLQYQQYLQERAQKHPLNFPNCGSVFRNPPGLIAAKLIEECGLKGLTCGGAQVSTKHANFIINYNHATAQDIEQLIQQIIIQVRQRYQLTLIPEVQIIGE